VQVNGTATGVTIEWVLDTYPVYFAQTSLPSGTEWYINVTGQPSIATASGNVSMDLTPGNYSYSIATTDKEYAPLRAYSEFTVSNTWLLLTVGFALKTYEVTFNESGLTTGTGWSITLNGSQQWSVGSTDLFDEPNGTWSYSVGEVPGWTTTIHNGSVMVNGDSVNVTIPWTQATYLVTFTEAGLPSGTGWSVTLNEVRQTSTNTTMTFSEPNGTYAYTVGGVPGWTTAAFTGSLRVNGTASGVQVAWTEVTYQVTFIETGLNPGANWSVTLGGVQHYSKVSTINFTEPNGTYPFTVGSVYFRTPTPSSGSMNVTGANVTQSISFGGGFRGGLFFIVTVVVVIVIIVVVVALIILRRRKKAKGGPRGKTLIDESMIYDKRTSSTAPAQSPTVPAPPSVKDVPPTEAKEIEPPNPGP
jgi:hypothetical protein